MHSIVVVFRNASTGEGGNEIRLIVMEGKKKGHEREKDTTVLRKKEKITFMAKKMGTLLLCFAVQGAPLVGIPSTDPYASVDV